MNIYRVAHIDFENNVEVAWFSNKQEAQQLLTELRKEWQRTNFTSNGTEGIPEPSIESCQIQLNKTDVLSFLNFYCHGERALRVI